jgi:integrase
MATLTVDRRSGKVVGYNIQWRENRRRHTIYLSGRTYRRKTVERFKEMVETLVYYRKNGDHVPDKAVANWLAVAPAELQAKLAHAGLIYVTKSKTCQELWDTCLKHKTHIKLKTLYLYRRAQTVFFETFSPSEPIEKMTADRLLEWKAALLTKYATASVAGMVKVTKMVFEWAFAQDWLPKNPMKKVSNGSFVNRESYRTISMEEYAKLLDASPNQDWRTIIALARIGGLRCPSELIRLRWSDVNWAENRFVVHSPKTEQHEGHQKRIVPLFPELRLELERHFFSLDKTKDNEFVIEQFQKTTWSLHSPFQTIACRAGLGTIIRPFGNMRMSRSNEVERKFGSKKESLWIGHSEKVMVKHYLVLEDDDYAEAAGTSFDINNFFRSWGNNHTCPPVYPLAKIIFSLFADMMYASKYADDR